jgi:hypothetical protein
MIKRRRRHRCREFLHTAVVRMPPAKATPQKTVVYSGRFGETIHKQSPYIEMKQRSVGHYMIVIFFLFAFSYLSISSDLYTFLKPMACKPAANLCIEAANAPNDTSRPSVELT